MTTINSLLIVLALLASVIYQIVFIKSFDFLYLRKPHSTKIIGVIILINISQLLLQKYLNINEFPIFFFQIFMMIFVIKAIYYIDWTLSIYVAIVSRFYVYSISHIIITLTAYILKTPIHTIIENNITNTFLLLIGRLLTIVLFVWGNQKLFKPHQGKHLTYVKKHLHQIILIQLMTSFLLQITLVSYVIDINPIYFSITIFLIMYITFVLSKIFFENALELSEKAAVKEYSLELERQIIRQTTHYNTINDEMVRFREFNHDYYSLLEVLESLIGNHPTKETDEYINSFIDEIKSIQTLDYSYSNNIVVDALLAETCKICKRNKIEFNAKVFLDDRLNINSFTIVRVASNTLRNSIEACSKLPIEDRFISIETKINGMWTIFIVKNSYNGSSNLNGDSFLTTKANKVLHGNGLKIIRNLIEKAGGHMVVEPNPLQREFTIKFLFKLSE